MNLQFRRFGMTIFILGATLAFSKAIDSRPDEQLRRPLDAIPAAIDGWKGEDDPPLRGDIFDSLAPTSYLSRTYRRGNDTANLFVAYYANQKAGESMHSPRHCLPGAGWEFLSYGETDLAVNGRRVPINRNTISKDGSRMTVFYWYQSPRRVIADEYKAKLFLIRDAIVERHTGGAIVRVICAADPASIEAGLAFSTAVFPELQLSIGESKSN